MRTVADDPDPRRAPLPPSFPSPAPTERGEGVCVSVCGGDAWSRMAGVGRRQDSRSSLPLCERTASRKAPYSYLCSLVFMFSFTLKCRRQTQRQRWIGKQSQGGRTALFVKMVPTMLTAVVCVNISGGRQGKMTILKYDRWEIMEGGDIFHSIKD